MVLTSKNAVASWRSSSRRPHGRPLLTITELHRHRLSRSVNDALGISPDYELAKSGQLITERKARFTVAFEDKKLLAHPLHRGGPHPPEVVDGSGRKVYARPVLTARPDPGEPSLHK